MDRGVSILHLLNIVCFGLTCTQQRGGRAAGSCSRHCCHGEHRRHQRRPGHRPSAKGRERRCGRRHYEKGTERSRSQHRSRAESRRSHIHTRSCSTTWARRSHPRRSRPEHRQWSGSSSRCLRGRTISDQTGNDSQVSSTHGPAGHTCSSHHRQRQHRRSRRQRHRRHQRRSGTARRCGPPGRTG